MGPEHSLVRNRSRCIIAFMALGSLGIVAFFILPFTCKKQEAQIWDKPRKIFQLNDSAMVKLFQNQSSTYAFLTAINYTQKGQGLLEWDEQMLLLKNVNLDETRTKISVKEQGIYLVFVQATFKLQASHNASLRLQVNHEYKEREDYITAVFHKQCGATMEIDAVLSHPVLLRIVQGDVISICVEPTELVDFELRPTSSYLLLLKVADL